MRWVRVAVLGLCCSLGFSATGYGQGLAELLDDGDVGREVGGSVDGRQPAQGAVRTAVPNPADLRAALAQIRRVFMVDGKAVAKSDAKSALASRLIDVVAEEPDATMRYALLQAATELAVGAGALEVAENAIGQMAKEFDVDGEQLQQAAYRAMAESAPVEVQGPVVDALLRAASDAAEQREFDDAEGLYKDAITAARRSKDRKRQAVVVDALNELRAKRKAADKLQPCLDRLREDPADREAAEAVGKQWCFVDGRWEAGLRYLAMAGDPSLSLAARAELQAKSDPKAKFAAAELWEKAFAVASKAEKPIVGQHIVDLYMAALPGLTGLAKVKAEKAIEQIQSAMPKSSLEAAWLVVFRGSDASIWDTDTREGVNRFAMKLADVPNNIQFLRMKSSDGESVLIPMSKAALSQYVRGKNYIWTGYKQVVYGATVLGIGDRTQNVIGKPGVPVAIRTGEWCTGYGFGPDGTANNAPTPAWANKRAPGITIEIAVTGRPLIPEEQRVLLDMGELEPER